jgi:hypothetical protein
MCENNLHLLQICLPFLDFYLSSLKFFIKSYITIRFTTSFETMIINFKLYSECKVCWFTFGIIVVISTWSFVFKCLWGKNTIRATTMTKSKSLPRIAFYMCLTCIGLLNIKTEF